MNHSIFPEGIQGHRPRVFRGYSDDLLAVIAIVQSHADTVNGVGDRTDAVLRLLPVKIQDGKILFSFSHVIWRS